MLRGGRERLQGYIGAILPIFLLAASVNQWFTWIWHAVRYRKGDKEKCKPSFDAVAKVVFSSPSLAAVGMTEEEAIEQEKDVDVFTSRVHVRPFTYLLERSISKDTTNTDVCSQLPFFYFPDISPPPFLRSF